ncbi:tryptophan halogenase [Paraferrimonas haliotis]|uniref:Tryptophan halogenase n=1 Tax=Paraferrimonas haliotis TaxID=2013866 RepID=A0AA37TLR1_9GAMM|nr:tryptophan halogenase [Paraferrimonas haliotis]
MQHIVVLGGGSAGWLTAGLIAAEHPNLTVTLIESPNIATIGVGEGTWPSMRNTLKRIGINELEFLKRCDASFKQGSKFIGWRTAEVNDSYYHPFMVPEGYVQTNLHYAWQTLAKEQPFAAAVNVQASVCDKQLAPKQASTPEYAAVTNYGYHLDAAKFAELLAQHCCTSLGVNRVLDEVVNVTSSDNGDIKALTTQEHGDIDGDLFIDCSGIRSRLLGEHYQVPMQPKADVLANDRALGVQIAVTDPMSEIESTTLATAQRAGWIWQIGLPNRLGIGYTYASQYETEASARQVLENYLSQSHNLSAQAIAELMIRPLSFTPGYRQQFWKNNCVAVGMAAGFIEPLEASALAMVELSASMLSEQMPVDRDHMQALAQRFNSRFQYRWERVIEFLKLHYVLSQRNEPYWLAQRARESIPPRLLQQLQLWQYQPPSRFDFVENEEIFSSASYQYVLYGMGFNTLVDASSALNHPQAAQHFIALNKKKMASFNAGLPSNRDLLRTLLKTKTKETNL